MKLIQLAGDWWWPKLSADGRFVAAGGGTTTVRMLDLASKVKADLGAGRLIHWFNDTMMTWVNEDGPLRDARWVCKPFGVPQRTTDDPAIVAGNDFAAAGGHWASWLATGMRLAYDNKTIATGVRGCAMAGNFLLTATDTEFILYMGGVEARRFPLPARANAWTISDGAIIGYGYYWPAHLLFFQDGANLDLDITATAWQAEGVPIVVTAASGLVWAWTHTVRPSDQRSLVIGRPVAKNIQPGVTPCIVIEDFPANTLDVVYAAGQFVLAGADTDGTLHVHSVAEDTARVPVIDIASIPVPVPTPTPAPTPTPSPEPIPQMADYTYLVAEERAKYGTPLGNANAWAICNAVALRLRQITGDQNWGLHKKGGNNYNGYAVDIVAYNGGYMYDILGSSEDAGTAQWIDDQDPTTDWAPPVASAPAPVPTPVPNPTPVPEPVPTPDPTPSVDLSQVLAGLSVVVQGMAALNGRLDAINTTVAQKGDALVTAVNNKTFKLTF